MPKNIGYATPNVDSPLAPLPFDRAPLSPTDVWITIAYCGVSHSDVHQARDEWQTEALKTNFPCMPGHEIAGTVAEVGDNVSKFQVGDRVGVGCLINFCGHCANCQRGLEQYCLNTPTMTYNTPDPETGEVTFGGYSDEIVVTEQFVLRSPKAIDLQHAAPLLCAGITTYSPLRHWQIGAGHTVGVAGIGGLGQMAVKIAKALGVTVVALTTSPGKIAAAKGLGADDAIVVTDEGAAEQYAGKLDFILSTIPVGFDLKPYLALLGLDGTLVNVGMLDPLPEGAANLGDMAMHRLSLGTSLIGGIAETQEMLDFCAQHGIVPEIQIIPIAAINDAFEKVIDGDVRFRFVIDSATLSA